MRASCSRAPAQRLRPQAAAPCRPRDSRVCAVASASAAASCVALARRRSASSSAIRRCSKRLGRRRQRLELRRDLRRAAASSVAICAAAPSRRRCQFAVSPAICPSRAVAHPRRRSRTSRASAAPDPPSRAAPRSVVCARSAAARRLGLVAGAPSAPSASAFDRLGFGKARGEPRLALPPARSAASRDRPAPAAPGRAPAAPTPISCCAARHASRSARSTARACSSAAVSVCASPRAASCARAARVVDFGIELGEPVALRQPLAPPRSAHRPPTRTRPSARGRPRASPAAGPA